MALTPARSGNSSNMAKNDPVYDIVLVGATGYTGMLTAEHITQFLPTNIRWAIEGRSKGKLDRLATRLGRLSPDRTQPGQSTTSLSIGSSTLSLSYVRLRGGWLTDGVMGIQWPRRSVYRRI